MPGNMLDGERGAARRVASRLPRVSASIIVPAPLRQALEEHVTLTVLHAPRGFGKTSAVAAWVREQSQAHKIGRASCRERAKRTVEEEAVTETRMNQQKITRY